MKQNIPESNIKDNCNALNKIKNIMIKGLTNPENSKNYFFAILL